MKDFAEKEGITLASSSIYMRTNEIGHALRDSKEMKNITVSKKELTDFPRSRAKMDLYYDKFTKNFTYVGENSKFIISSGKKIKIKRELLSIL